MAIDHTGAILFPSYTFLRIIGRLAFPIYTFLLVEGFFHTRDIKKYTIRLGVFALISEIPFDLAFYKIPFYLGHQNIFFTLLLGMLALMLIKKLKNNFIGFFAFLIIAVVAELLHTDYGAFGILLIGIFYGFRKKDILKTVFVTVANIFLAGGAQAFASLSMIPILFYNGKKGPSLKYVFYGFYPIHLLILYIIYSL
ncbi:MAG: hypothetical protein GX913_00085 [Clostridiales bacterium]|nr:hypothetical protein [Clostridiales bacterium]